MGNRLKWLMLLLAGLLVGAAAAVVVEQYTYQNTGSVVTVGVSMAFLNGTAVTMLDWGAVENETAYVWREPFNLTNLSNVPVNVTLNTADWVGIIDLQLAWNSTEVIALAPQESVIVELTQTVTATGDWSYTTVIKVTSE